MAERDPHKKAPARKSVGPNSHKPAELRPIMTRLPESLRVRLKVEAEKKGRSLNGEVIDRLENSFRVLSSEHLFLFAKSCHGMADALVGLADALDPSEDA